MTQLGPYTVHPFADAFPLIDGEEFDELVLDVKRNGLREPIVLSHDQAVLVDGRNRYRACAAAGVDPALAPLGADYTEPMVLDLIVSKNLARRQLNPGQRNALGVEYEEFYAAATKAQEAERKLAEPRNQWTTDSSATPADRRESHSRRERESSERAARVTGGSGRGVQRAKAVKRDAPDLYDQVRSGATSLDRAYSQTRERARSQPKPDPAPKPTATMLTLRTHDGAAVDYPKPQAKAKFNETSGDGISWARWSWNPVTGCLHGCAYCYAREIATSKRYEASYPVGFTPLFHHERLDAPVNTVVPSPLRDAAHEPCGQGGCEVCAYRRVFVCSMADLYGRWVPDEWISDVHAAMLHSPEWEYLLLTKFPQRYVGLDMPPRAWLGTSVDEQKRVRIAEKAFRELSDVAVKWLSLEPLTEPLEFTDLSMFDWVVIGAQTETRQPTGPVPAFAPPFEWVARIVAQAREAGCKVHLKPNLAHGPGMTLLDEYPTPNTTS